MSSGKTKTIQLVTLRPNVVLGRHAKRGGEVLGPLEFAIVGALDGRRSIAEIARMLAIAPTEAAMIAQELIESRRVEPVEPDPTDIENTSCGPETIRGRE